MLFSVYDTKEEIFGPLWACDSLEGAKREFIAVLLSERDTKFNKFPYDFQLYHVGDFDVKNGNIEACCPYPIMTGLEAFQAATRYKEEFTKILKGEEDDVVRQEECNHNDSNCVG